MTLDLEYRVGDALSMILSARAESQMTAETEDGVVQKVVSAIIEENNVVSR